jgi:hypothetical protein
VKCLLISPKLVSSADFGTFVDKIQGALFEDSGEATVVVLWVRLLGCMLGGDYCETTAVVLGVTMEQAVSRWGYYFRGMQAPKRPDHNLGNTKIALQLAQIAS